MIPSIGDGILATKESVLVGQTAIQIIAVATGRCPLWVDIVEKVESCNGPNFWRELEAHPDRRFV
jgi:hypothetical protein